MIEPPVGRKIPKFIETIDQRDVNAMFRFRAKCRAFNETGLLTTGILGEFWVDERGEFMDGKVPYAITELEEHMETFYR